MRTAAASSACTSPSSIAPASPSDTIRSRARVIVTASGDDIDVLAPAHHVERLELEMPVGHAFAGRDVVFVAVPRAHEVCLGVGEFVPMPGTVGAEHVLDLVHDDALARGAALMDAEILVGVILALPVEHADL